MSIKIDKRKLLALIVAGGVAAAGATAWAMGCCGTSSDASDQGDRPAASDTVRHGGHATEPPVVTSQAAQQPLHEPLSSVLANYIKIGTALAGDKTEGVAEAAQAIAQLVKGDAEQLLPEAVATHAVALAGADDLQSGRATFKSLSAALIGYLDITQEKVKTGRYYEVYCPMAQAGWLQTNKVVRNPYYGTAMLSCGEIRRAF